MIGRTYLERGEPVVVRVRWAGAKAIRNVLIERADGTLVVRPFRGLRRAESSERTEAEERADLPESAVVLEIEPPPE